jgi:hypothetical protein
MADPKEPADGPQPDPKPEATGEPKGQPEEKTVTLKQSELDQMIQDRALRETRSKYSDYDELKAKAEKLDAAESERKTEIERATEAAATAQKRAEAAEARELSTRRETAIMVEASKQGADTEIVLAVLANSEDIMVQDGKVLGVQAAVTQLLEDKPHLKIGGAPPRSGAAEFGGNDSGPLSNRIRDLEMKGDKDSIREARTLKIRQIAESQQ